MFKMIANMLDVNQSVLSGAMDIVVVRNQDDSLTSSSFHIRFGTLKILKAREKIVEVYVNNEKTHLNMKLSSSGDAYFTQDKKENKNVVPDGDNKTVTFADNDRNEINVSSSLNLNNFPKSIHKELITDDFTSPLSRQSAPNTPTRITKQFDDFDCAEENLNLDDCEEEAIPLEEKKDNEVSCSIKIPSFNTRENDLSPKFNPLSLTYSHQSNNFLNSVQISLCYNEILKTPEKAEEIFTKFIVKKEEFFKDPWKVLNNSNLLLCYDGNLYTYTAAAPLLLSRLIYGEEIPASIIHDLNSSNKGLFGYFKQRNSVLNKIKVYNGCDDIVQIKSNSKEEANNYKNDISAKQLIKMDSIKTRSFTPSSNQLKLLKLKDGVNEISFVCKSRLSGQQTLKANIYLWDYNSKIVISDVDGTITRSDVLGQLMPMIGKDWSHEGVTDLFTNIEKNGYKMLYLTARAICQSSTTKTYIESLFQNKKGLPRGPILMSPDGLVSSFKREVIDKTPQTFKIACLTEVKNLFPKDYKPFLSGFGNRTTDAVSYRSVGIELSKIFIINESGEVTQLNNSYKKTYTLLNEIVDELFPPVK